MMAVVDGARGVVLVSRETWSGMTVTGDNGERRR